MLDNIIPTMWINNTNEFYKSISILEKYKVNKIRVNCTRHSMKKYKEELCEFKKNTNGKIKLMLDIPVPKNKVRLYYKWDGVEKKVKYGDEGEILFSKVEINELYCKEKNVFETISRGEQIIIGDNSVCLKVLDKESNRIRYKCVKGGTIPYGKYLITDKIKNYDVLESDIQGYKELIDIVNPNSVAFSFVEDEEDIRKIKKMFNVKKYISIGKIETDKAIDNIDNICSNMDEIMIGRGDLYLNTKRERLYHNVNKIVDRCIANNKECYVASGFFENIENYGDMPSRSEMIDISLFIEKGCNIILGYNLFKNPKLTEYTMKTIKEIV